MDLELATPTAALLAVAGVVPLAALAAMSARARRVRMLLGLREPRGSVHLPAQVAIVLLAVLLAAAAAQPVVAGARSTLVRSDAQAFFVIDTSRSMLAGESTGEPTRLDRARATALGLRREIGDVPVGLASLTDRLLPHVFPTPDAAVFRATLARSLGVGRPPPQELRRHATTYEPLENVVRGNLFPPGLERRALVVLTDGEARESSAPDLREALRPAQPLTIIFVRFWGERERVFRRGSGEEEEAYLPEATSGRALADFARTLDAEVFGERELAQAASALRRAVGDGPRTEARQSDQPLALAPYFAGAAFAPLLFLLWTRNRA